MSALKFIKQDLHVSFIYSHLKVKEKRDYTKCDVCVKGDIGVVSLRSKSRLQSTRPGCCGQPARFKGQTPVHASLSFQAALGQGYHSFLLESAPSLVCRTPHLPGFLPSPLAAHPQSPLWLSPLPDFWTTDHLRAPTSDQPPFSLSHSPNGPIFLHGLSTPPKQCLPNAHFPPKGLL